jgi:hypothetical protein
MTYRIRLAIVYLLLFIPTLAFTQSISNVRAENQNGKVIVTYDLNGTNDVKYVITLYGSHDNFQASLKYVAGDVGKGVAAGTNKRIEWDIAQELISYQGNITFKIRGEVIPLPLAIKTPAAGATVRLGKSKPITWSGGRQGQSIRIELMKDGAVAQSIGETTNTGAYQWSVPKDLAKGNYQIRLTGGNETLNSETFNVKKKIPIWMIAAPVIVVGVVVAILAKPKASPGPDTETDKLPDAPAPNN